jgi:translation elongation factor EF-Tu-like GTPase
MSETVRFRFTIEKVYALPGRGIVVTGRVEEGSITVGAAIGFLGGQGAWISGVVSAIEVSQRLVDEAQAGQAASLLLEGIGKKHIQPGMVLTEVPELPMAAPSREYEVETHYPAPMPIPSSGRPIHPTSSFGRTALFLLIGILIALALLYLQER